MGTCAGGVRFSNSNRIIHSDYRILLLLKMHIPNIYIYIYMCVCVFIHICVCVYIYTHKSIHKKLGHFEP